mgnify:CR=1 FL=1
MTSDQIKEDIKGCNKVFNCSEIFEKFGLLLRNGSRWYDD